MMDNLDIVNALKRALSPYGLFIGDAVYQIVDGCDGCKGENCPKNHACGRKRFRYPKKKTVTVVKLTECEGKKEVRFGLDGDVPNLSVNGLGTYWFQTAQDAVDKIMEKDGDTDGKEES